MTLRQKLVRLKKIILECDSCLIAFSGGVDSSFLLKAASEVLQRDKLLAVTADSPAYPKEELLFAKKLASSLGVRHKIIKTYELKDKRFVSNPINRCYFCKSELFTKLKEIARKFKLNFVADASSVSDKKDFRPGSIAKKELGIRSPLIEAGLCKEDIRRLSRSFGLSTYNKPALACLASRFPYGTEISKILLRRINKAEKYLRDMGFKQVRVRHYDGLCRIEVFKNEIHRLISKRSQVIGRFKKLGYKYITIDLEGYRAGSMNPVRSKLPKVTATPLAWTSNGVNEAISR